MCKYKQNGVCQSPIPVKCTDECGLKHETDLYNAALKELEETREELQVQIDTNKACEDAYKKLEGQYNSLLDRYNKLQAEIDLSN